MNETAQLTGAFAWGAGLGLLYFLGLWATVRRLPTLRLAPLWLLISLALRLALLLGGLYWIGGADWRRFAAALVGIILVRLVLTRRIGGLHASALPQSTGRSTE